SHGVLHHALREVSLEIAAHGTFNIMLSNGDLLFTHCSTQLAYVERRYPFNRVALIDIETSLDLSAHNFQADRMVVIATKPLTREETWVNYQPGQTLMFRAGLVVARGELAVQEADKSAYEEFELLDQIVA